jgi:hypothetical protein
MNYSRYITFVISVAAGIGLGLLYGWVISPVQLVETSPATLRVDYKTDYVLMVAEVYSFDDDAEAAVCRLALLGGDPRVNVSQARDFAKQHDFAVDDQALIRLLDVLLESWEPDLEVCQ